MKSLCFLLCIAVVPALNAGEVLDLTDCGQGRVFLESGDATRGLPHWDPVEQVLRDRITVTAVDGAPLPRLHMTPSGSDQGLLLPERVDRDRRAGLRASGMLGGSRRMESMTWDLVVQGRDSIQEGLVLSAGCAEAGRLVYLPGSHVPRLQDSSTLTFRVQDPETVNRTLSHTSSGPELALFRYDQLWPKAYIGSATGWFVAANRFPLNGAIQVLEVQFIVAPEASGTSYQVLVFHDEERVDGPPSLDRLVYVHNGSVGYRENDTFVRVPLVEAGLQFDYGTLWIGVRNGEGQSLALAVGAGVDHLGNSFLSTSTGETFHPFGLSGPGDGRPMIRALVEIQGEAGLLGPAISSQGSPRF